MNKSMLMKMWWNIEHSYKKWAQFLCAKFFRKNGELIDSKPKSPMFLGVDGSMTR